MAQIASRYGVSYLALARYNGISNPNIVHVGQRLRIPPQTVATPAPAPTRVAPSQVAPTPQTSTAALTPIQAQVAPTRRVSSPEPQPTPTATVAAPVTAHPRVSNQACGEISYSVRRGDSLYGIGATYGVSVSTIISRNHLPSTLIYVGQRLIIPLPGC
ncbi:MAG: LysM peptidoglycan-binding domain-containing protein [Caldilineaceae bacterium]|nr:LysM peptidoglycan-binding domain-containing protein [Caldilineaceae bacterium]